MLINKLLVSAEIVIPRYINQIEYLINLGLRVMIKIHSHIILLDKSNLDFWKNDEKFICEVLSVKDIKYILRRIDVNLNKINVLYQVFKHPNLYVTICDNKNCKLQQSGKYCRMSCNKNDCPLYDA